MTVVLVHGNPETDAVWGPLVDALELTDVGLLSRPGFGAPLPDGFSATFLSYRDWLIDELQGIDGPVDLVGHDWGGGHVVNAVMHRPHLVRSWATDVIGLFDPDYGWHDTAQGFQTPETGEQLVAMMREGSVQDRALPLRPPTGSGRGGKDARERRGRARSVTLGHRGPLCGHRGDAPSGRRPSRRADRST